MLKYIKEHMLDIIITSAFVFIALLCLVIVKVTGKAGDITATIYIDGEIAYTIDLAEESSERDIEINDYLVIRVKHNAIKILENDCPSKYCVHQGYTDSSHKPLICAYHKIYIKINVNNGNVDVVAG